jgi:hypothetical protein
MAFPENRVDGGSSTFADDGTASHELSAHCLNYGHDAEKLIGSRVVINSNCFVMDEDRARFIQVYLDDVRRRAMGGALFVEYKVDLSDDLGTGQGGTADVLIYQPQTKTLVCEDLKYGTGEKVYAQINGKINPQLALYPLGALKDMALLGYEVEHITAVVCQPRLGWIDEHTITVSALYAFAREAREAVQLARMAMLEPPGKYQRAGEKQCRWCRAPSTACVARNKFVTDSVKCDFDTIAVDPPPIAPRDTGKLATAYLAVPLIEAWCRAVRSELTTLVSGGTEVIGPDDKPYKFVEGKPGGRAWTDVDAAEAALLGQLGPVAAYAPQKIITAPAAAKLLDKKATKAIWADVFEPMIKKPPGKAQLALGSDPRPPFNGAADLEEFEDNLNA